MTKQTSSHAGAAKLIRAELKKRSIKGRVNSKSYSGGNSITVTIEQDINPEAVKSISDFCDQFEYGHFDGMDDSYHYSNRRDDIPQVKFMFVSVDYSEKIRQAAKDYIANINGIGDYEQDHYSRMALSGSWGDFWTTQ